MNFRMTIYPAIERRRLSKSFIFVHHSEMIYAKNVAADLLIFLQDELKVMDDYSNLFLLEERVNGEWQAVDNDDY